MKRLMSLFRTMLVGAAALFVAASPHGQPDAESGTPELDTRIWSQSYWLKMAELGLVELATEVSPKKAVYTSSRIDAHGVVTEDSPDVAVTEDPSTTQSENSIFVHPLNINTVLNSNNSTDWPVNTLYGADALYSTDGGLTWGGSIQGAGGSNSGDPAAAIGLNGWFYVGYIAPDYAQGVAYSTDGGSNWTHVQVAGGGWILDKNHLWIDNSPSSPYQVHLYSAWTNFQGGPNDEEIELARSIDSGKSWLPSINISSAVNAGSHNQGVNIQTGPNGEVYVAWSIYDSWPSDETAIGFARSTDGGATFEPATRIIENIRGIRTTHTSKDMRVNSFPVMSVDISGGANNGTIYIVWANIGVPDTNTGPDIDVYMIKSTDGGSSWSTPPIKVNQDPSGLGKEHYFPWITCDPVMGALSVVFYDDRNVSSTDCEVFVASSADAGATWIDFKVSDVSFTPSPIPGLAGGYFGDYLGISARSGKVYPCWTDNRQGSGRAMTYVSPFALEEDTIPPDAVTDLATTDVGSNWITLTWTASGDDGDSGKASSYDVRYSTSPIDEGNFDSATPASNPPTPQEPGSAETFTVKGLDFNTTYFFALKVRDEWGNASGVSNSPSETTLGIPDIEVSPDSLVDSLLTGDTSTYILTIENVGEDPSTLDFFFPQYGGEASLRVTSVEGNRLSFQVVGDSFISVEPTEGTVLAGDSVSIAVTLDATGMFGGDYEADIEIYSNDPDEPIVIIPVHLHVTGAPDIAVSPDSIDYGVVFIGGFVTDTLTVINVGTDLLTVSDISSDNPDYTVDTTSFDLDPFESRQVLVTFTPTTTGAITSTLTIISNDPLDSIVTVALVGEGAEPPDISVTPDSLSDSLFTGDTSAHLLTIGNFGFNDLIFQIEIEGTGASGGGLAASFDGVDDYVQANPVNVDYLTLEVWVNYAEFVSSSSTPAVISNGQFYLNKGYMLYQGTGAPYNRLGGFVCTTTGNHLLRSSQLLNTDQWYHVAMTYDGSEFRFYINGDLDTLTSVTGAIMPSDLIYPLLFGVAYQPTGNKFEGVIDEVRIWDYARTQPEIQSTMNTTLKGNEPGLVGYWNFDGGNPWADLTGNGNDGTPYGGVGLLESGADIIGWLSTTPISGVVPPDSSMDIVVTFDANGLNGGDYYADIEIHNNDPDESLVIVPAYLHVTGAPDIAVSPDSIDYGLVFIGASVTDSVIVSNVGTDLLTVSDISSDNPDYTVDTTSFDLDPFESRQVLVTFTPTTTGAITSTLTITSDDPTDSIVTVSLEGEGALPPDISVTPDSLSDSLFVDDTSTHILTIYNTGVGDLTFNVSFQETDSAAKMSVEEALASVVRRSGILENEIRVNLFEADFGRSRERVCIDPGEIASVKYAPNRAFSAAGPSVAIVAAAGISGQFEDVQEKLLGTGKFNSVAIIDANLVTPSVVELQEFDAVIVWPNSAYEDQVTLGDNLADYVDAGGRVVLAVFETAGSQGMMLGGRWASEEYFVIVRSSFQTGQRTLGTIEVPFHPTVAGVSSFDGGSSSFRPTGFSLTSSSSLIATWSDGRPLVAVKKIGDVNRVDLGFYPPSSDIMPNFWQVGTDGDLLLANALEWVAAPIWLAATPSAGTVLPDSSMDVQVTFNAAVLDAGDHSANIIIASNDPDEPVVSVLAQLHAYICGDIDGDARGPNIVDVIYLVDYLFFDGSPPPFMEAANVDSDNGINVADLTYLVDYLFFGGPQPVCEPIE